MPKEGDEFNDLRTDSAVASLDARRFGRVVVVVGKGIYRVRWSNDEDETLHRTKLLARYTTQSAKY